MLLNAHWNNRALKGTRNNTTESEALKVRDVEMGKCGQVTAPN